MKYKKTVCLLHLSGIAKLFLHMKTKESIHEGHRKGAGKKRYDPHVKYKTLRRQ